MSARTPKDEEFLRAPRELEEIVAAIRRYAGSPDGIGRNHAESLTREAYLRGVLDAHGVAA